MLRKLSALVGFGAGYVLCTRAGREQYEKIIQMLQGVKENPRVQETTSMLSQQATELAGTATTAVQDKVSTATDKAKSAISSDDSTIDVTTGPMAGAAASGSAPDVATPGAATRPRTRT